MKSQLVLIAISIACAAALLQLVISPTELIPQVSSTAALLRSRGYLAHDHNIEVQGGRNTLNLVKATNPLILGRDKNNSSLKEPLLFVHGLFMNAKFFVTTIGQSGPRDYSGYDINLLNDKELENLLEDDKSSQSLSLTALNFGYDVWLLNRRGTIESWKAHLKRTTESANTTTSSTTLDEYWDFSLDEQARYDLPEAIRFVLDESGRKKVTLVASSVGTAITLMALSEIPELAANISKALLWAPVLEFSRSHSTSYSGWLLEAFVNIISRFKMPFPPQFWISFSEVLYGFICSNRVLRPFLCHYVGDITLGEGMSQTRVHDYLKNSSLMDQNNMSEIAQLLQSLTKGSMHKYDHYNSKKNLEVSGATEPDMYNITRIQLESLSFWYGNTDTIGRARDFNQIESKLTVPCSKFVIGDSGIKFNHEAFRNHESITKLLIIPSLRVIAASNERLKKVTRGYTNSSS